jgi:hypothetical protein
MQRRRPDMIYEEVPDRGHVPFLDEPESLARSIPRAVPGAPFMTDIAMIEAAAAAEGAMRGDAAAVLAAARRDRGAAGAGQGRMPAAHRAFKFRGAWAAVSALDPGTGG